MDDADGRLSKAALMVDGGENTRHNRGRYPRGEPTQCQSTFADTTRLEVGLRMSLSLVREILRQATN